MQHWQCLNVQIELQRFSRLSTGLFIWVMTAEFTNENVNTSRRDFHKNFQINEKGRLANRSRDPFVFVDFFVASLIPEQQFAWTRVMHADLTRIALFWASKLEWISMNLAHTGQIWRVSFGLHILGVDIIRLGRIARMRKKKRFIFYSKLVKWRWFVPIFSSFYIKNLHIHQNFISIEHDSPRKFTRMFSVRLYIKSVYSKVFSK